ncbi:indolepyruvate ferredoxin oxidoreductase family protein [Mycolicibacterium nivoides]|uniref:indolepyruvate ferredoxin oxidoreductase family protein n=1 Tax=Mycolicibacterium nivoides TaxID=2487344 RepID=UPI000F5BAA43|nr:indolepyruvate ferredoxin oxidoreductase family protein [Mycolicibacterium nivoides]QRY45173.1 indolepyruvate ferredoxin oxidoreductase family protein [Mycolicibacterium boenickei]
MDIMEDECIVHLTGIQALARMVFEVRRADLRAGMDTAGFVSGYEGSPLAGFDTELSRHTDLLHHLGIVFQPAVNEELAATAVQGSQLAATQPGSRVSGVTGFWYGKSPGLDRASDAIRHANLMGTHPDGGVVALVGDDPAAKSSTVPGASEYLLADLGIPTLYPADPQELIDFGMHAVALSRASGLWTALKVVTNVADASGTINPAGSRIGLVEHAAGESPYRHRVSAHMLQPSLEQYEITRDGIRRDIATRYAAANGLNPITGDRTEARIGIAAAGKTYLDLMAALRILGLDQQECGQRGIRLLRFGMINPLDSQTLSSFAAGLSELIVVEDKRPFLESAIKDALYGVAGAPRVTGKKDIVGQPLFALHGELEPDTIALGLARRLRDIGGFPSVDAWSERPRPRPSISALPLINRTPYFCSGCPHNSSAKVPDGTLVGAGIGCHGMVTLMDEGQVGHVTGMTQMGGEGAQWIGIAPFVEPTRYVQNLGDGTFHHSGSLAIRAAVAAGITITYKLLYNSAVAMTGGQQAVGLMTVAQICRTMAAEGVARIIITTEDTTRYRRTDLPANTSVWDRTRLDEAQLTLTDTAGVTLLIHDQECATELRRKRKRGLTPAPSQRIFINERVCEGCGDCGQKSNCLSVIPVDTEFGRKTHIDQSSCNQDLACLAGDCPSFISVTTSGSGRRRFDAIPEVAAVADPSVPEWSVHTTRIAGIGGSGVVTLAQILATAAAQSGIHVRALDQTGLAQKGGAVISDIKLTRRESVTAHKAASGECDLYLGCDLLVAADPKHLTAADPHRTVAVVSSSEVPTGRMVVDPTVGYPDHDLLEAPIRAASRRTMVLDARRASNTLLGDEQYANLLLVGAAYQIGALPLPASAIENAIATNGVKVEANIAALRYGRFAVADPGGFAEMLAARSAAPASPPQSPTADRLIDRVGPTAGSELLRLLRIRIPELIAYQDVRYAEQYSDFVSGVLRAEAAKAPGSTALTEAVAANLYKLMAYKDEYEVARLSLDPAVHAAIRAEFGADAAVSYRLHPPALRAMGMQRKLELGPWIRPAFRVLIAMRRLRGTALDPFGHARVRRLERALIGEYRQTVEAVLRGLSPANIQLAVEIARLPDGIRGYESIKTESVHRYRAELAEALARYPAGHD